MNEVELEYDDFAQLTAEYQSHSGAVNTGTTPRGQYAYADGSANTVRPTTMTYPDGRALYGATWRAEPRQRPVHPRIAALVDETTGKNAGATAMHQARVAARLCRR